MAEDVRRALVEERCSIPAVGSVVAGRGMDLPFVVTDAGGQEVESVSEYLRDLVLGDVSPLTCRSYAFDLLRWHRLLWMLETPWEKATEAEVAVLVGWLRQARNPQRRRRSPKMLPRLDEIEDDLLARRARAEHEAWLGEVEGIDLTLTFLRQKREETKRLARIAPVDLGIPVIAAPR